MLLAVDAGNTNTVFAVHDGKDFRGIWRCQTAAGRTADEYFVWLERLMQRAGIEASEIQATVIASVVPAAGDNLRRLSDEYFGARTLVVGSRECETGIQLRVDRPDAVGADRIANAVGAGVTYGNDLIVVDFGTATTFDVIDGEGTYVGGVIAPGISLSLDALHRAAASLPRIDISPPETVIGRDTVPAMRSGIYWGYLSLIDGICARVAEERGTKMRAIATGGLAPLFQNESVAIDAVDPHLTMRGLVEIYRRNPGAGE